MEKLISEIQAQLFALQDETYRAFQCKLMPTVDPEAVIGVRTPALRALAKALAQRPDIDVYLAQLPHQYYEENNLHGFLLERTASFDRAVVQVDAFLPYVDNWATCDQVCPKVFGTHLPQLLPIIRQWLASGQTYTVRFAVGLLMRFYLDGAFSPEYPALVATISSDEYYVNMMLAWYFATALAKQWQETLPYLVKNRLPQWVHNKTIQKAVESYRITDEQKTYLKTLKRK